MPAQPQLRLTPQEYLIRERRASFKSEYRNGEVLEMAPASRRHILIATNLSAELGAQLKKKPCTVYISALRMKVNATGLYTYPDVMVVCGAPQFDEDDEQLETLMNPTLIVEVLSPSTEDYDRGSKFGQYRTIPSIQEYLLIAQDRCHAEHFVKQPDQSWLRSEASRMEEALALASIGCTLALAEVYDEVDFTS